MRLRGVVLAGLTAVGLLAPIVDNTMHVDDSPPDRPIGGEMQHARPLAAASTGVRAVTPGTGELTLTGHAPDVTVSSRALYVP